MDEENGNDGESGTPGNPYISGSLCAAYRETMRSENEAMEEKILFTIKVSALLVGLCVTILQLGLYFLGGT